MKNILTLTDFSETSELAIEAALKIAKRHNAELHILHVLPKTDYIKYELDKDPEIHISSNIEGYTRRKIDTWKLEAIQQNIDVNLIFKSGEVIESVQKSIEDQNIDLVVMGSSGINQSSKTWGSITQDVTKNIQTPILVIKSKSDFLKLEKIVFASDLDIEEQNAFKSALQMLNPPLHTTIHLMSVDTSSFFSQPQTLMTKVLETFKEQLKPYKTKTTFYRDYAVNAGIRHYVENVKPDLLIMCNVNRNPIVEFFNPNPAIIALENMDYPILILRPQKDK